MLSWKRMLYVVLIVSVVSCVFMIYNINEERARHIQIRNVREEEREFVGACQVSDEEKPGVRLIGDEREDIYKDIYRNTRQLFDNLHFTVIEETWLDAKKLDGDELIVFCDDSLSSYTDLTELGAFIERGGKVILAAGLPEGYEDSYLWPFLGIREKSVRENYNRLSFEGSLMPLQFDEMVYDGYNASTWLSIDEDAEVYVRDADTDVPLLYTCDCGMGRICLINGTFLADVRCMGLLTGALSVTEEDFIYPVLGTRTVFLDNFPMITFINDKVCMQMYGCSTESFVRDVVWPGFQGMSLRTQTPYTSSILAVASEEDSFPAINDSLFTTIGRSALQFEGELIYAANCKDSGQICFNHQFIDEFEEVFRNYEIQGLAMQSDHFHESMLQIPGSRIRFVRTRLDGEGAGFSSDRDYLEFPAATAGNSMEEGNLFAVASVLASYGMVSHVFDINTLIAEDESTASWDRDKKQIDIFESEILQNVSWLEKKVLSQTGDDIRSYLNLEYGWKKDAGRVELNCSNMVKGQAFYYRTDEKITGAEGLTYEEIDNGYYLLRVFENHAVITVEGE